MTSNTGTKAVKLSPVALRVLGILVGGQAWALIHVSGEVPETDWHQGHPRRAWVYTDIPQAYDYAPTIRIPARSLDKMIRDGLIECRYRRGGDVPFQQWGITDKGRAAWEAALLA